MISFCLLLGILLYCFRFHTRWFLIDANILYKNVAWQLCIACIYNLSVFAEPLGLTTQCFRNLSLFVTILVRPTPCLDELCRVSELHQYQPFGTWLLFLGAHSCLEHREKFIVNHDVLSFKCFLLCLYVFEYFTVSFSTLINLLKPSLGWKNQAEKRVQGPVAMEYKDIHWWEWQK